MITQSQVCETRIDRRTFFTGSFLCCARARPASAPRALPAAPPAAPRARRQLASRCSTSRHFVLEETQLTDFVKEGDAKPKGAFRCSF